MTVNEINILLQQINKCITLSDYDNAYNILTKYFSGETNERILFSLSGQLIDIGFGLRDEKIILEGINNLVRIEKKLEDKKLLPILYYNLGNGYEALYKISEYGTIEKIPISTNLQNAKSNYLKSIDLFENVPNDLRLQLYTNYGNCLSALGRTVEALLNYNNALDIDNSFPMALINKAQALIYFSSITGKYKNQIIVDSYQMIKTALTNKNLADIGTSDVGVYFKKFLIDIEDKINDGLKLNTKSEHPQIDKTSFSNFEIFYINYCSDNQLFLNFHVHNDKCLNAICDPIFISIVTDLKNLDTQSHFFDLATCINQIKEDYITSRYLFVTALFENSSIERLSNLTSFARTKNNPKFNLYSGLLKTAFIKSYNILDKIAVFLNKYFELGYQENKIYFHSIWENRNCIKDKFLECQNISIYALYDIYKEFKVKRNSNLSSIRNSITHRKLIILDEVTENKDKFAQNDTVNYQEMIESTLNLLQLTRSAIIYLINFVNTEELKKLNPDSKVAEIFVDRY